ncbi:MAG: serine hydrolase [Planctomycetota bacterium]
MKESRRACIALLLGFLAGCGGGEAAIATRAAASDTPTTMAPWNNLPPADRPIELVNLDTSDALDDDLQLPPGSTLTIAKVVEGHLHTHHWQDTGERGFYPASTVKLITAVVLLDQLDALGVSVDGDIQLGDEPRKSIRETLVVMIRDSGNDEFNTLQESVGFAETDAWLKSVGCETGVIRRHFTRPHWNSSRPVKVWNADGRLATELPERPGVDFPLNAAGGESNWFTTDDLVRVMAATMLGGVREKPGFDVLAESLRVSGGKFLGAQLPPRYSVYSKVGWWPPDGAYSDVAYIHDTRTDSHYFIAAYCNGPERTVEYEPAEPRQVLGTAAVQLMEMIDAGKLTF